MGENTVKSFAGRRFAADNPHTAALATVTRLIIDNFAEKPAGSDRWVLVFPDGTVIQDSVDHTQTLRGSEVWDGSWDN